MKITAVPVERPEHNIGGGWRAELCEGVSTVLAPVRRASASRLTKASSRGSAPRAWLLTSSPPWRGSGPEPLIVASCHAASMLPPCFGHLSLDASSIVPASLGTDTTGGATRDPLGGFTVTREEKAQAVDSVLGRYEHLGATVVSDDSTLCRLLQTLECSGTDRDVGEYLCSFLAV